MSLNLPSSPHPTPKTGGRKPFSGLVIGLVTSAVAAVGLLAWSAGFRPHRSLQTRAQPLETIVIDRGNLSSTIVETGSVESASNVTVRCQVEALIGMVGGGKVGQNSQSKSSQAGASATGTGVMVGGAPQAAAAKSATKKTGASVGKTVGAAKSSTTTSSLSSPDPLGDVLKSGSGGGSTGSSATSTTLTAPQITSFTMTVPAYMPLRPASKSSTSTVSKKASSGGSRGSSSSSGGGETEKPGSTRILWIKPEGTPVKAGDVVCELDSAAFRDELLVEQIKYDQAKSFVDQARALLGVNELALKEYIEGIFPQDRLLIRQYIAACQTDEDRLRRNVEWSTEVTKKGIRSPSQHEADLLNLQRARIALSQARTMEDRLINYTAPKLIKTLQAKLEANRADVLAQESAFQLESDRLHRIQRMVEHCTLKAPGDGIVVYAPPPSNGWRTSSTLIQEGVTVREGQPIFELPSAEHMRVKARVNESKVRQLEVGQKASIRIDAFPDHVLSGTITEITVIPAPGAGPFSDTRVYFANVALESGGLEGLRPGLSAEVSFLAGEREQVIRIPQASIRWHEGRPFVAITTSPDRTTWEWRPIDLGLMDESFAEVVRGLDVGDRVVAKPYALATVPPRNPGPTLQASGGDAGRPSG